MSLNLLNKLTIFNMNFASEISTGNILVCVKGSRKHGTIKGKFYVYDSGTLVTYTTRSVTELANGYEILENDGSFEMAERCPFCGQRIYDASIGADVVSHDGIECARLWDAKVKNYCADCNADLVSGECHICMA